MKSSNEPERPYDEDGDTYIVKGNSWLTSDDCVNTVEDKVAAIATQIGDNVTSQGNVQNNLNGEDRPNDLETSLALRRFSRQRSLPSRYKVRLVAKGYNQREGIDYEETSSHVVKMVIVRCLIALFLKNNWHLYQLDVNNDFLYGDLNEEFYMELPPEYYDKNENKVSKLIKSLYGLKQAIRQWNEKFTTTLIENGFVQSKNDYSLYVKSKNGLLIAILVYVDDIVIIGNNETTTLRVLRYLKNAPGAGVQFNMGKGKSLYAYYAADWAKCPMVFSESEYGCLTYTTYELIWVVKISKDSEMDGLLPAHLYCDSNSTIQIVANPVFHEKTKHFEIDLHLVRENVSSCVIKTLKVAYANNIADIFTMGLSVSQHKFFCEKLGLINMFKP
ncbi:ribonuclease H-like domain-containing protein [Tanacetum coccineum]|uniref:Ribonuclease H-like domain-containing protein n=1 Tax=Tanacetum coccineum TaxID=301880 RepID=A0ABQ5BE52_9ASTR